MTTTLDVTIKNDLVSIFVKKEPTKTIYTKGENLDISGGIITAKFEDNSTTDIEMTSKNIVVSGFNGNKVGEQELIVTYEGKEASFKVEVKEAKEEIYIDLNGYGTETEEETTYITNLQPKTTKEKIESPEEGIKTNGKIEIWNGDTEVKDKESTIETGYRIVIKDEKGKIVKEYIVAVKGDCNGDGKQTLKTC